MKKLILVSVVVAAALANLAAAQQGAVSVVAPNGMPVVMPVFVVLAGYSGQ